MINIDDLGLTTRARNCLRSIDTIEQLQALSAKELLEMPNLGVVSLAEIAAKLSKKGIWLNGFTSPHWPARLPKPIKKTELIKRTYWACTIEEHRHWSENGAKICINKLAPKNKPDKSARDIAIKNEILNGQSCLSVGEHYNLSAGRVHQIVYQQCRLANHQAYRELIQSGLIGLRDNKQQFL